MNIHFLFKEKTYAEVKNPQETQERRQQVKAHMQKMRADETPEFEQTQRRRQQDKVSKEKNCADETPEQTQRKRQQDKVSKNKNVLMKPQNRHSKKGS